jgi:hypothetical protein
LKYIVTGKRPLFIIPLVLVTLFGFRRFQSVQSPEFYSQQKTAAISALPNPTVHIIKSTDRAIAARSKPLTKTVPLLAVSGPALMPPKPDGPTNVLTPTTELQPVAFATPQVANHPVSLLDTFIRQVSDGQSGVVKGLFVDGVMAVRVVQQPQGNAAFISVEDQTATQFQSATPFNVVGLLAHNFLAGRDFFRLKVGQDLILVYGDGKLQHYRVSEIGDFQRLTLSDLRSDFLELSNNQRWTTDQVFSRYYQKPNRLTLQTCIEQGGVWDWGVRFITADLSQTTP